MSAIDDVFESEPLKEFGENDTIERWLELKESGQVYLEVGDIAGKVRKLLEENKMLKEELARMKKR